MIIIKLIILIQALIKHNPSICSKQPKHYFFMNAILNKKSGLQPRVINRGYVGGHAVLNSIAHPLANNSFDCGWDEVADVLHHSRLI
eukprot:m.4265 g.4265  ORF g.4265 m.4265 type:complete len:87 (+) comp3851_c1_seq1:3285-3545(+)